MDKSSPKTPLPAATAMVRHLVKNTHLLSHEACPFSFHLEKGHPNVLVLAGDNATGKSLLSSMLGSRAYYEHGVEPIIVSMMARTSAGMLRAFTYGGEEARATGDVSVGVSLKALRALASRVEERGTGMVVLDEPDFGLAEGYGYAFGQLLGQAIDALPAGQRWNVVVVSHSRELVRGLADTLERAPSFVHAGEKLGLRGWLEGFERHSPEALEAMLDRARAQQRQVREILNERDQVETAQKSRASRRP